MLQAAEAALLLNFQGLCKFVALDSFVVNKFVVAFHFYFGYVVIYSKLYYMNILYYLRQLVAIKILHNITHYFE